jgi:hypothetical protein
VILLFRSMVVLKVGAGFLFNLILNNGGISLSPLVCFVVAVGESGTTGESKTFGNRSLLQKEH